MLLAHTFSVVIWSDVKIFFQSQELTLFCIAKNIYTYSLVTNIIALL